MKKNTDYLIPASIVLSALIIAYAWTNAPQKNLPVDKKIGENSQIANQEIELPVVWGNLGAQMISAGVIDRPQFEALYATQGGLSDADKRLFDDARNGNLKITDKNSGIILNLLWALGLGNKNSILENGPMSDPRYGNPGRFASTGGWTLAKGNAMEHYSKHLFINLTPPQQALVEKVSKNIYRPCCNNSTYFPDCNHGMAMLGLLELLASQNKSEDEMYKAALQMNSFWFSDQYATIAKYLDSKGIKMSDVGSREILGTNFSSASGYGKVASQVKPIQSSGNGGCGVESSAPKPKSGTGCGVQ